MPNISITFEKTNTMSKLALSNLSFLIDLKENNNRDWFTKNKSTYIKEREKVISFANELLKNMNTHDHIENESGKKCMFRIYRDVRFSKNKLPYKTHWGLNFKRATKLLRGGYYLHIEPNNSFIGGGFWNPEPKDLKRIRMQLSMFGDEFKAILNHKTFLKTFGKMQGNQLKNGPKGFDKDNPFIDLLKYKQYLISRPFTDKEILSDDFAKTASNTFKKMRPFLDFMSEALTTDINGEPLY